MSYNIVLLNYMFYKMKYFAHNTISFGGFHALHYLVLLVPNLLQFTVKFLGYVC